MECGQLERRFLVPSMHLRTRTLPESPRGVSLMLLALIQIWRNYLRPLLLALGSGDTRILPQPKFQARPRRGQYAVFAPTSSEEMAINDCGCWRRGVHGTTIPVRPIQPVPSQFTKSIFVYSPPCTTKSSSAPRLNVNRHESTTCQTRLLRKRLQLIPREYWSMINSTILCWWENMWEIRPGTRQARLSDTSSPSRHTLYWIDCQSWDKPSCGTMSPAHHYSAGGGRVVSLNTDASFADPHTTPKCGSASPAVPQTWRWHDYCWWSCLQSNTLGLFGGKKESLRTRISTTTLTNN